MNSLGRLLPHLQHRLEQDVIRLLELATGAVYIAPSATAIIRATIAKVEVSDVATRGRMKFGHFLTQSGPFGAPVHRPQIG